MRTKVLTLGLICLLMLGPVFSAEKKDDIKYSWRELFPGQIERLYIIMKDGTFFKYTSLYEDRVYVNIGILREDLKKIKDKNYNIKEIAIIIHNHFKGCRFSPEDRKQYRRLKRYGFNGFFLLYCHSADKVYDIEDKEKST